MFEASESWLLSKVREDETATSNSASEESGGKELKIKGKLKTSNRI
jgi:hypothetical protein